MKQLATILFTLFISACNTDNAPDCLKSSGEGVTKSIDLAPFNVLMVNNEFFVVLTDGPTQQVSLTTGSHIFDDITFESDGATLEISNTITCKWSRDYNLPILEITHPQLDRIEITGGSTITSGGVLSYPGLTLVSKKSNGTIKLTVESDNIVIDSNEITNYWLSGSVKLLNLNYSSGNGRFEGTELLTQVANISHNGSNDVIVNVVESITGSINSTGDLIFVRQPPARLDVEETNRGRLINATN